jgi:hypothetical protein
LKNYNERILPARHMKQGSKRAWSRPIRQTGCQSESKMRNQQSTKIRNHLIDDPSRIVGSALADRFSFALRRTLLASRRCAVARTRSTARRKVGNNTLLTRNNAASRKPKPPPVSVCLSCPICPRDSGSYCPPNRALHRVKTPRNESRYRSAMYGNEIFLWSSPHLICVLRVRRWGLRRLSEVHPHSAVHSHWRSGAGCSRIADASGDVRPRHIADRPE